LALISLTKILIVIIIYTTKIVSIEDIDLNTRQRMFFQQNGAPAHWSRRVKYHLDLTFPSRWIGRGGPVMS